MIRHRPVLLGLGADGDCPVARHNMGIDPALLGPGEAPRDRLGHPILLLHTQPIGYAANVAAEATSSLAGLHRISRILAPVYSTASQRA